MTAKSKSAIVLLSGGLDSMVVAGLAREAGYDLIALTIDYNQRHRIELDSAATIAAHLGAIEHIDLDFRRECMREACQDWEVPEAAWEPLVASLVLPDPDDRHVLAAAIAGHADYIVTLNLRDFPQAAAAKFGIEVVDPDTFLLNQWDLEPEVAAAAFQSMRERRRRPEFGPDDFARALQAGGLPLVAQRFREVVMA
jgi:hypothetical protein